MSDSTVLYEGEYPVPEEWVEKHLGKPVAFVYVTDLGTLIDLDGIEGMNDYLDQTLGMSGADLTDISYGLHPQSVGDGLGDNLLIRAEGILEGWD